MTANDMPEELPGRWAELLSPAYRFATVTVSLGIVLFAFNAFLVSTALPTAVLELGGAHLLSWSTSLYLILSIVSGASTALVMQRTGARAMFVGSAIVFLGGTLVAGAAQSMAMLLCGRALQGIAAGFIEAGCYVLIPRLFPSRLIPKVFGVEAIAWALAAFGGPVLAGYLAQAISWRASLLSAVPLVVVFLLLVPIVVARDVSVRPTVKLPWLKLAALSAGMLLTTLASIMAGPVMMGVMLAAAAAIFCLTVASDHWVAPRLLPTRGFSLTSITGLGFWTALLMPVAQAASVVFLVYALQFLWHYAPLDAGLVAAIMALSWSGSQFLLATFAGPRFRLHMIWLGPVLLVAGLLCVPAALAAESLAAMVLAQMAIGAAFGLNWSTLSQVVMEAAPETERDATSALLPTIMAAGYGIGAAIFGVAGNALNYAGVQDAALLSVMTQLFVLAAAIALLAVLSAFGLVVLVRRRSVEAIASTKAA